MNLTEWRRSSRLLRLRRRVHRSLDAPIGIRAGNVPVPRSAYVVEAFLIGVILANSTALILWTVPELNAAYGLWFAAIEYATVAALLAEYGLRCWIAPEARPDVGEWRQRLRYLATPAALVDAAALAPSLAAALALLVSGDGVNLSFLLAARLLTRSAKLFRYVPGGRRLLTAFRLKAAQLLSIVAGLLFVMVIAAFLMYFAESGAQPDAFPSIPAAMWWSVITLTTVGYGDTVPVTSLGRLLAAVIGVLGIGLFALPAGILSAGLVEADVDERENDRRASQSDATPCPHCGQPMFADSTARNADRD